nr:probable receptor-like protein kinase At5g59700 [Tanacetum cinerariifolium]
NRGRPESTHTQMPESNSARSRETTAMLLLPPPNEATIIKRLKIFQFHQLRLAWPQIDDGGFGVVHIGRLSDRWQNHEAAIKRLDNIDHQGKKEFLNELRLISSLDHHLQDQNKRHQLPWSHCIQYALIIAKPKWGTIYM